MNSPYTGILTRDERESSVKLGMALKTASLGKDASVLDELSDVGTRTLLTVSLVTGIPLGIAAHLVAAKIRARSRKEKELQDKIDYYRSVGRNIEGGLQQEGVQL